MWGDGDNEGQLGAGADGGEIGFDRRWYIAGIVVGAAVFTYQQTIGRKQSFQDWWVRRLAGTKIFTAIQGDPELLSRKAGILNGLVKNEFTFTADQQLQIARLVRERDSSLLINGYVTYLLREKSAEALHCFNAFHLAAGLKLYALTDRERFQQYLHWCEAHLEPQRLADALIWMICDAGHVVPKKPIGFLGLPDGEKPKAQLRRVKQYSEYILSALPKVICRLWRRDKAYAQAYLISDKRNGIFAYLREEKAFASYLQVVRILQSNIQFESEAGYEEDGEKRATYRRCLKVIEREVLALAKCEGTTARQCLHYWMIKYNTVLNYCVVADGQSAHQETVVGRVLQMEDMTEAAFLVIADAFIPAETTAQRQARWDRAHAVAARVEAVDDKEEDSGVTPAQEVVASTLGAEGAVVGRDKRRGVEPAEGAATTSTVDATASSVSLSSSSSRRSTQRRTVAPYSLARRAPAPVTVPTPLRYDSPVLQQLVDFKLVKETNKRRSRLTASELRDKIMDADQMFKQLDPARVGQASYLRDIAAFYDSDELAADVAMQAVVRDKLVACFVTQMIVIPGHDIGNLGPYQLALQEAAPESALWVAVKAKHEQKVAALKASAEATKPPVVEASGGVGVKPVKSTNKKTTVKAKANRRSGAAAASTSKRSHGPGVLGVSPGVRTKDSASQTPVRRKGKGKSGTPSRKLGSRQSEVRKAVAAPRFELSRPWSAVLQGAVTGAAVQPEVGKVASVGLLQMETGPNPGGLPTVEDVMNPTPVLAVEQSAPAAKGAGGQSSIVASGKVEGAAVKSPKLCVMASDFIPAAYAPAKGLVEDIRERANPEATLLHFRSQLTHLFTTIKPVQKKLQSVNLLGAEVFMPQHCLDCDVVLNANDATDLEALATELSERFDVTASACEVPLPATDGSMVKQRIYQFKILVEGSDKPLDVSLCPAQNEVQMARQVATQLGTNHTSAKMEVDCTYDEDGQVDGIHSKAVWVPQPFADEWVDCIPGRRVPPLRLSLSLDQALETEVFMPNPSLEAKEAEPVLSRPKATDAVSSRFALLLKACFKNDIMIFRAGGHLMYSPVGALAKEVEVFMATVFNHPEYRNVARLGFGKVKRLYCEGRKDLEAYTEEVYKCLETAGEKSVEAPGAEAEVCAGAEVGEEKPEVAAGGVKAPAAQAVSSATPIAEAVMSKEPVGQVPTLTMAAGDA